MKSLLALLFSTFVVACSSSSSSQNDSQAATSCRHIFDVTCTTFERCGKSTKSDCLTAVNQQVDCNKAVSVSQTDETNCVNALQSADCATFPPLPTQCDKIVKVSQ